MRLEILHPEVADRDCLTCQQFQFDDAGNIEIGRDGQPERRPRGVLPPCRYTHKGCPKGTPENQRSLTEQNRECWDHYRECRAVGVFPDDPLVRHHAALIRDVEDECNRVLEHRKIVQLVTALIPR